MEDWIYVGRLSGAGLIVWAAALVLGWLAFVLAKRHRPAPMTLSLPGVLIISTLGLCLSILAFTLMHAHPLLQYNDESTGGVWGWWGLVVLVCGLGLPVICVWLLLSVLKRRKAGILTGAETRAVIAALIAGAVSWWAVMANFPTA